MNSSVAWRTYTPRSRFSWICKFSLPSVFFQIIGTRRAKNVIIYHTTKKIANLLHVNLKVGHLRKMSLARIECGQPYPHGELQCLWGKLDVLENVLHNAWNDASFGAIDIRPLVSKPTCIKRSYILPPWYEFYHWQSVRMRKSFHCSPSKHL